ncbi:Cysteine-rich secretory protein family protein [Alteromonadaceae bacterium Bs31]|nr:Cysteine-rich secretory protein family protein [Alteromonadaceae bacterium Bs31]
MCVRLLYLLCYSFLMLGITACGGSETSEAPSADPGLEPSLEPTSPPSNTNDPETGKTVQLDCGSVSGGISANRLDSEAKEYLLCKHNQTRSQVALGNFLGLSGDFAVATDMKRLQWDAKLEQVAQAWASQCQWQHNANRADQYNALSPTDINGNALNRNVSVGENLAFFSSSNLDSATMDFAVRGYDAWEDEGRDYSIGSFSVSDHCDVNACGHFTQLIWASSYKVACAVSYCPAGTVSSYGATYLVCNYASAGNYSGQLPYKQGSEPADVCSEADNGQALCKNGLTEANDYRSGF